MAKLFRGCRILHILPRHLIEHTHQIVFFRILLLLTAICTMKYQSLKVIANLHAIIDFLVARFTQHRRLQKLKRRLNRREDFWSF